MLKVNAMKNKFVIGLVALMTIALLSGKSERFCKDNSIPLNNTSPYMMANDNALLLHLMELAISAQPLTHLLMAEASSGSISQQNNLMY
jgi:hypothetical protein